ncbi:1-phosphofructokinase family hexose kinase [Candidatus Hakubella thermalkaliphila]|uniref:Tagatose 6-phosphate kinase n=1 Tax=Candidatus Hakubella thermalkaliphila TaxID=2754717 RepID=A0A6V8PAS6_9ACTN|nr:1-phosphofructokinase family hexose kinase [Candidatus Hakubella thermalkaliphila]GFP27926.1 tagatose 6-phosphate kinase [Candidatus Hakubella thermalkaliphila]
MILTVTLNPCIDKTIFVTHFQKGKKVVVERVKQIAGGKGNNVARVIKNLGHEVLSFCVVGGQEGRIIEELLGQDSIPLQAVWAKSPSRTVTTVLETKTNRQTVFVEPGFPLSSSEFQEVIATYTHLLSQTELVVLSGSIPPSEQEIADNASTGMGGTAHFYPLEHISFADELGRKISDGKERRAVEHIFPADKPPTSQVGPARRDIYAEMIKLAREKGIRVILDSHGEPFRQGLKAAPFLIKPNVQETKQALGLTVRDEEDLFGAMRLCHEMGIEWVVQSLGQGGALASFGGKRWRITVSQVPVVNPVGSGDAMVGALAVGLARNLAVEECLKLGVAAGAANAAMWDAASCSREDIEEMLPQVAVEEV